MLVGIIATAVGGYDCMKGHNYAVAAQHEATVVGRIVGVGRHGVLRYEFTVNGVKVDDYSEVCTTPLAPDACRSEGPVLVYYSYQPYPNSLLEDFAVASNRAYRTGKPALSFGLALMVLSGASLFFLQRRTKPEEDSDSEDGEEDSDPNDPEPIHIVPAE